MKKIAKSQAPNELTAFALLFPNAEWDPDFRDYAVPPDTAGHDYKQIKRRIVDDQGGLCAYCEMPLGNLDPRLQRVEHYHPKSDKSVPGVNWGLLWSNIIVVCTGGENEDRGLHPRPANLSCDAHKNHWLSALKLTPAALLSQLATLQNPLGLAATPCPFGFDRLTGKLTLQDEACIEIDGLLGVPAGTSYAVLDKTINVALNLNCDRLCTNRLRVLFEYNREVALARKNNISPEEFHRDLAARWFVRKWPSYFTTRRILLGRAAEAHLEGMAFAG